MDSGFKRLILLYFMFVLVKLLLVSFIPAPSAFSDDYVYVKMAQSFYDSLTFSIHGVPTHQYPPLYPIVLSFSYILDDMRYVYFVMKLVNVLLSSLIIFPVFLLAREFLSDKKSLLVAVLVSVLPSNFSFSGYIMAENLFYPLFMFSMYFVYKSFTGTAYLNDVFAGLFIGLTFLSRSIGIVLVPITFLLFCARLFQKRDALLVRKILVIGLVSFLVVSPWLVRNGLLFGFTTDGILGSYASELSDSRVGEAWSAFWPLVTWSLVYLGYIALASGVVFFILSFMVFKRKANDKLFLFSLLLVISVILSVLVVANHSSSGNRDYVIYTTIFSWLTGRVMGRYIDFVLPLVLIAGFVGLQLYKKKSLIFYSLLTMLFLFFASQIVFFPLFPVNNPSLTHFGFFVYAFDYLVYGVSTFTPVFSPVSLVFFILLFVLLPLISLIILYVLGFNLKKLFLLFLILFLSSSILVFAVNYYNSEMFWYRNEGMQLGLWINDNVKQHSVFLFDWDDSCKIEKLGEVCVYEGFSDGSSVSVIDFWMDHDVFIGDVSNREGFDYLVTKKVLDLPIVYQRGEIYLYRVV